MRGVSVGGGGGVDDRVMCFSINEKKTATATAPCSLVLAPSPMPHTARRRRAKRLLERVLKRRQLRHGEPLLLLDGDGLLLDHRLDINRIPPEPLHDVLVDPRRRR